MNWQEREAAAAAVLRDCRDALAASGGSVIREAGGGGDMAEWQHYPAGEVYDPKTHAQYFYHRHPAPPPRPVGRDEHGHFHLFLRSEGIPAGVAPLLLPELAVAMKTSGAAVPQSAPLKRGSRDEVCHLVAIGIDAAGEPIRLFTTNRWVTGESWYRADDVIRLLGRFRLSGEGPSALLNRWLGALVTLFQPDIAALLRQRDEVLLKRRWRWRGNVLEDMRLEVTSSVEIDLDDRLAMVAVRAQTPPAAARVPRRPLLPPMAEGWGA